MIRRTDRSRLVAIGLACVGCLGCLVLIAGANPAGAEVNPVEVETYFENNPPAREEDSDADRERERVAREQREAERREQDAQEELLMSMPVVIDPVNLRQDDGDRNHTPSETIGGRVGGERASITALRLVDGQGREGMKFVAQANSDFGRNGTIVFRGEVIRVSDVAPVGDGIVRTEIAGARVEVTRSQSVGDVSGELGGVLSVTITDTQTESEGSSSSSRETDADAGFLGNISIPGATAIFQTGVGLDTSSSETTTRNDNLVTTTQSSSWGFGISSSITLEYESRLDGAVVGESNTVVDSNFQLIGGGSATSVTVDATTNETVSQQWTFTDQNIFTGEELFEVTVTNEGRATLVYEDGDGNRVIRTAVPPPPPPTNNPFRTVPDEETDRQIQNVPSCVDDDDDGWGWDGSSSCKILVPAPAGPACIDDDGDGWGWDGSKSCKILAPPPVGPACVDADGDGWGWDGSNSCKVSDQDGPVCIDEDGDGWGWDGSNSCKIP